jgi:hypothetical protein
MVSEPEQGSMRSTLDALKPTGTQRYLPVSTGHSSSG